MTLVTENRRLVRKIASLTLTDPGTVYADANRAAGIKGAAQQASKAQLGKRLIELRRWLSLIDEW